ncbi:MAG: MFS transporter [Bacteroidetes bacterium]|nr:MAG: MFS transporter [Bacteroidota bacterium]
MQKRPAHILPLIVLSQFAGTSLWFAGNAILPDIQLELNIHGNALGNITSVVQFGFIAGTLVFAIFSIADRFASSKVFFVSCMVAAAANVSIIWLAKNMATLFVLRFITGFFLAGIYPVGMKIAADWYEKGLGKALGYLVGALAIGTAFPHLLKSNLYALPWKQVLLFTSLFAVLGGLLILLFVGEGPFRKEGGQFRPSAIFQIFRSADFRAAAFGYFGHMWELYTFWAFVPTIISLYSSTDHEINISSWSFMIIAIGGLSCVAGGYMSQEIGSGRVAFYALICSGLCCLASFSYFQLPFPAFVSIMLVWGISVIADSPQFSTLVAQTAIPEYKGTALTMVTSVGFAITIASVQLINYVFHTWTKANHVFVLLAPGPIIGLIFLLRLVKEKK